MKAQYKTLVVKGKKVRCRVSKKQKLSYFVDRLGEKKALTVYKKRMRLLVELVNMLDTMLNFYKQNVIRSAVVTTQEAAFWRKQRINALNKYNHYQQIIKRRQPGSVWAIRKPNDHLKMA